MRIEVFIWVERAYNLILIDSELYLCGSFLWVSIARKTNDWLFSLLIEKGLPWDALCIVSFEPVYFF